MVVLENAAKMLMVEIKKALDCLNVNSIIRVHEDLEFLVSRWSMKSHTCIAA